MNTDTSEPPRRRGQGSLPFMIEDADPAWRIFKRLAVVAHKAKLTEREAAVLLLHRAAGMTPNEIAKRLKMKRQHFWRHRRHINSKLEAEYGDVVNEVHWWRSALRREKADIIQLQRNTQGSSRTPIYYLPDQEREWRAWTSPTMILPEDLHPPYVQPIDIV